MRIVIPLISLALAAAFAWFAAQNWFDVSLKFGRQWLVIMPLPLLLAIVVSLALAPAQLWHSLARWRLRRRVARLERLHETARNEIAALKAAHGELKPASDIRDQMPAIGHLAAVPPAG